MLLVLEKWLQLFTPSYICILCNKTLQHLPSRDVSVPGMKRSCDLLWLITWGRSDGMPIPNLGFKWSYVFPLSFWHHCVYKLQLACCMMRSTSSGHPADSLQTASVQVRPSKTKTSTQLTHEQAQSRWDRPGPLQQNFPADVLTREWS